MALAPCCMMPAYYMQILRACLEPKEMCMYYDAELCTPTDLVHRMPLCQKFMFTLYIYVSTPLRSCTDLDVYSINRLDQCWIEPNSQMPYYNVADVSQCLPWNSLHGSEPKAGEIAEEAARPAAMLIVWLKAWLAHNTCRGAVVAYKHDRLLSSH